MVMEHHDVRGQVIGEGPAEGRRVYYRDVYVRSVGPHTGRRAAPISARQHLVHTAHTLSQLSSLGRISRGYRRSFACVSRRASFNSRRGETDSEARIRLASRIETPLDRKTPGKRENFVARSLLIYTCDSSHFPPRSRDPDTFDTSRLPCRGVCTTCNSGPRLFFWGRRDDFSYHGAHALRVTLEKNKIKNLESIHIQCTRRMHDKNTSQC